MVLRPCFHLGYKVYFSRNCQRFWKEFEPNECLGYNAPRMHLGMSVIGNQTITNSYVECLLPSLFATVDVPQSFNGDRL